MAQYVYLAQLVHTTGWQVSLEDMTLCTASWYKEASQSSMQADAATQIMEEGATMPAI